VKRSNQYNFRLLHCAKISLRMHKNAPFSTQKSNKFSGEKDTRSPHPTPLIACKLKQSFIGQAVVQAAWQRSVISPLLLGLALDLDLKYSSQTLLDKMSCLGVCVSYEETNWYKQSTMLFESTGSAQEDCFLSSFTQWVGDTT